ncbi:MAG: hypothetical protein VX371_05165 [Verrucomicrobiota bacterium]|nr:hypothetical protein [Verrucomicrobiota bacterium]
MIKIPQENPTEDELANMMDEEASDSSITGNEEGAVEAGIPPSVNLDDPELEVEEEAFSIDDFESNLSPGEEESPTEEQTSPVSDGGGEEAVSMPEVSKDPKSEDNASVPSSKGTTNGLGGVAEFRKTLANLSRQLEIDRLAFLHKSLEDRGEALPTLEQIAGDIHGIKPMSPDGDCDYYGKRPAARLEGWISGLSFGANRRAKKFSK